MPLYRVHAYDGQHRATLVILAETPDSAGRVACQFVSRMDLGYYPANHETEFPEVVGVEQASSWFDAAEPFMPVVESVEEVDEAALSET